VTAFYVVSEDLKLWLGIHPCLIREKDVIVALKGVGALCDRPYHNLAVEGSGSIVIKHSLEELGAVALRRCVINPDKITHVLMLVSKKESVRVGLGIFAGKMVPGGIAYKPAVKGDIV
jgi:hypothetical protein